ncbi:hypothetical protein [Hymenobacter ruricola]|uniref:Lipocalin-like domain-containing protein n=1 Tax=Hymenobacter ruricola TaxID=2791023 RepID=A0ABS0IBR4_9BACT|nr:hypothetical protein [Hymenobacter ruricola]MBF9224083.1 hypothetical protein [Hymenobacter ruricola]
MTISLRFLILALLTGSAFGLTNCKKDKEPEPDKRSQREIWLTTTGWNKQSITDAYTTPVGVVTSSTSPPSNYFPACALDDLDHFNADRTLTIEDGPLQCQSSTPPSTITWAFAANETEIIFNPAGVSNKITTLTATTLALTYTEAMPDGTTWNQTVTYAAR